MWGSGRDHWVSSLSAPGARKKERGCLCRCWESASLAQGVKLPLIELDPFGPETAFHGNSVCVSCLVVSDFLQPLGLQPTRPLSPCGTHQARTLEPVAISFSKRNYQFSSVAQSCPTLCDPMNCNTPGLPVHHQLSEFTETHVHRVSDAIQPSHPLSSPSPPVPKPSQHQGLFQ